MAKKNKIKFSFSANFSEILRSINATLAVTTYKANKLVFIKSNGKELQLSHRYFDEPMGLALKHNKLAIATFNTVQTFVNFKELVEIHATENNVYDAVFYPKLTYYTNALDLHDLAIGDKGEMYAVSTAFSAIVRIDIDFHFTPIWQPNFITELAPEDRCHLNGMCLDNGKLKFATAFSAGNEPQSWRKRILKSGVIIDIESNEVLLNGLAMPHSPKIINHKGVEKLIYIESGKSEINAYNFATKRIENIFKMSGFIRGMAIHGNYVFVAVSKARKESTTTPQLNKSELINHAEIACLNLETGKKEGNISFENGINEIYDILLMKDIKNPMLLSIQKDNYKHGIASPNQVFYKKK